MRAGELRERVSILKPVATSDGQGGQSIVWVDLVSNSATSRTRLPAAVHPVSARESLVVRAISATISWVVTMRYRADIDETMRVVWRPYKATTDTTLEIHGVLPIDGKRVGITLGCSEA